MYAKVSGKCSPSLQQIIKGDDEYISKYKVFNVIWMLKKVQNITAGVYTKSKPTLNLHEKMMELFNMIKGFDGGRRLLPKQV